ncbi:cyclic nucleotide-binding domain-containing protein 1-like [Lytechinus variegatus]|uniref:cyclic nucleotide-binding domain-containing protein 1-like n=1 Tax=Lytechinus variegatus TaxID=7654 RepID=UPI001BB15FD0|nr:cyclic nucleotide-binding domain-containing protein 1-like [Lytechinus variegatus]XP_041454349.1 cyclic nucleotide-binding domain-containing protein 1-like [Lytechinus variegatus]
MALIPKGKGDADWSKRDRQKTRHNVPEEIGEQPAINYDKLKWLCKLDGLHSSIEGEPSSDEAHRIFMENYRSMFVNGKPKGGTLPILGKDASVSKSLEATNNSSGSQTVAKSKKKITKEEKQELHEDHISHDIREHMAKLHKERKIVDPIIIQRNRIKDLRNILKKMPYERNAEENDLVYSHLKAFTDLSKQLTNKELKELSTLVTLDVWRDEGYTVFANSGFFIVLKGSVIPQSRPWIQYRGAAGKVPLVVTESSHSEERYPELKVCDCFGTLEKVEGPEANSKLLTVTVNSVPAEFLKISSNDFKRITEQIQSQENTEKINLINSCKAYLMWPRQSLLKLAELLEWTTFQENTVLVSEGFMCPFIGFVKSGECHVLRQVEVKEVLPNGKEERRCKQVVMGQLLHSESFGEISVLRGEESNSSIVTSSSVELGVISVDRINELDETTRSLLLQSNETLYESLSETEIHSEYIDQEQKREWNQFKHNVLVDVINARGIRPGYGKWAK